jgi:hypothetical protein
LQLRDYHVLHAPRKDSGYKPNAQRKLAMRCVIARQLQAEMIAVQSRSGETGLAKTF